METTSGAVDGGAATDPRRVRRELRRARIARELSELFTERDELRGVSPVADFVADSVRWSA